MIDATSPAPPPLDATTSVIDALFLDGPRFDFFQAIRLLARLTDPRRKLLGSDSPPHTEIVRIGALPSLSFPASSVHAVEPPPPLAVGESGLGAPPRMTITFLGMIGPNGVLPRHYTNMLLQDAKSPEKQTLRAWLDIFTHRWASFFYRAWEKYRFFLAYERGDHQLAAPDAFTQSLYSLIGLGFRSQRDRLRIAVTESPRRERVLAKIDDVSLLHYGGLLAHRPRCAASLELFLRNFLGLPVTVHQFQGQWIRLEQSSQSTVGRRAANNCLGTNALVGDRIWDVGKIRVRLGPLTYAQFQEFLPDRSPTPRQKSLFLLAQLVRLFVGLEHDMEFQLVLRKQDVPATQMGNAGARLGWNTWSRRQPMQADADDPVFQADERVELASQRA